MVLSHHTSFVKRKMVSNVVELRIQGEGFTTTETALWWEPAWLQGVRFDLYDFVKLNEVAFATASIIVTILILFVDVIRHVYLPPSADGVVNTIVTILIVYVALELAFAM